MTGCAFSFLCFLEQIKKNKDGQTFDSGTSALGSAEKEKRVSEVPLSAPGQQQALYNVCVRPQVTPRPNDKVGSDRMSSREGARPIDPFIRCRMHWSLTRTGDFCTITYRVHT